MERVPEGTLQVDIYVTNTMSKKAGRRLPLPRQTIDSLHPGVAARLGYGVNDNDEKSFVPPSQVHFDLERQSPESSDEIVENYGELGHEQHVLDMTNFGGEDDTIMPTERELSRQLQAEGEIRRAETEFRKSIMFPPKAARDLLPTYHSRESYDEAPFPAPPGLGTDNAPATLSPVALSPTGYRGAPIARSNFVSDLREAEDMFVLSEMAHSGRAKMNEIIAEEAARCPGTSMLVCCCGPTALIASIRKHVAENIKPGLVSDGKAPAITLASEEFEN